MERAAAKPAPNKRGAKDDAPAARSAVNLDLTLTLTRTLTRTPTLTLTLTLTPTPILTLTQALTRAEVNLELKRATGVSSQEFGVPRVRVG